MEMQVELLKEGASAEIMVVLVLIKEDQDLTSMRMKVLVVEVE